MKQERDLLKYDLETAKGKLEENGIQIELETDNNTQEEGKGIKLIKEYSNKIQNQQSKINT